MGAARLPPGDTAPGTGKVASGLIRKYRAAAWPGPGPASALNEFRHGAPLATRRADPAGMPVSSPRIRLGRVGLSVPGRTVGR